MEFDNYGAVRIQVTKDLIDQLFKKRLTPTICEEGLEGNYKCVGVVQNPGNGYFEFILFNKDTYIEGQAAILITPIFKRIDAIDKQKVKDAIEKQIKHYKHWLDIQPILDLKKELGLK